MTLSADLRARLAVLEPGYADLLSLVAAHLAEDERVRALWLSGSVGRGVADAGSDLDLVVTVRDRLAFTDPASWDLLEPLLTTPIPGLPGCFAFTTYDGLRVDVVVETSDEVASSPYVHRVVVLDKDGFEPPSEYDDSRGPDLDRMQAIVGELLRQAAIFPAAVVARQDWLLGQEAVHNYRRLLYDLFVESNQPLPAMGLKQWSSRLGTGQRELLTRLPVPAATRDSVVAAMRATRAALRTEGRAALEAVGGAWPVEVDDAIAAYWTRHGL